MSCTAGCAPARAARAAAADAEGRRRRVRLPPTSGGAQDPAGWTATALDRPISVAPRQQWPSLRVPSETAAPRPAGASTAPAVARAALPAHLRTAPPCCPPALVMQTWGSGASRGAAQGGGVYGGLCGRACGARGGSRCRKGGGGRSFFLPVQRLTTPPVRACCVGRGRGGGGGSGSGPSTISTRALVSAGGAANGGGAGGGAPCALRLVLIPLGAPRGSQNKKNMILEGRRAGTRVGPWGFGVRG